MRCILERGLSRACAILFRQECCVVVTVGESAAGRMSRVRAVSEVVSRCWSARESSRVGAWESNWQCRQRCFAWGFCGKADYMAGGFRVSIDAKVC
jgi:hypothetical protein